MNRFFYVVLTFKAPNEEGKKINFKKKENIKEILIGVKKFNREFPEIKKLKIKDVTETEIHFYFAVCDASGNAAYTTRDLSFFSKRMYHDLNWARFSREESKMFTGLKFEEIKMSAEEFKSIEDAPSIFAYAVEEDIAKNIMTDEMCVRLLNILIEIKDFGNEETIAKKKQSIYKIKGILRNLFE